MRVRVCYTQRSMVDLGHRALVVHQNARDDPKTVGDPIHYVPGDPKKSGTRDDHRDPKMDAKKVDDLSHYVPDDPKKHGTRDDHRDPKMDAKKMDDQNHYVLADPKKDAKKKDDQNHYVLADPTLNEWKAENLGDHREMWSDDFRYLDGKMDDPTQMDDLSHCVLAYPR